MAVSKQSDKKNNGGEDSFKSFREGAESIVIAIVLAFLFRAFEAEAFVIPTGSMAPTLQGRHKDVECENCGYQYQTGDSLEPGNPDVQETICPLCRYTMQMQDGGLYEQLKASHRSHTGDRILVNKFAYERPFGNPKRWDVIVFKYPNNAKQNYIKRLIGLPNEEITIYHGDIYVTTNNEPRRIARKPQNKLRHIMQLVNDSNYIPDTWERVGWPSNWQPATDGVWTTENYGKSFSCSPSTDTEWIQFQQYDLDFETWEAWGREVYPEANPILITDFYTYNTKTELYQQGLNWVGDLAVEAEISVESEQGKIRFLLIEAGRRHACDIDLATGQATISVDGGQVKFDPMSESAAKVLTGQTKIKGKGTYNVRFANVDNQLTLWVNNRVCDFGQPATFMVDPEKELPASSDLAPARIGVSGAKLTAKNLRIFRDVYYIATRFGNSEPLSNYNDLDNHLGLTVPPNIVQYNQRQQLKLQTVHDAMLDPQAYRWMFKSRGRVQFKLEEDQFFPLGDNSPMSKDGRLWEPPHHVDRDMLIGKAVLVYWPHPIHVKLPFLKQTIPAFPNFKRMKLIR